MNYAIAFLGLIFVFASIYWYTSGRKFYTGPLIEAEIGDNSSGTQPDVPPEYHDQTAAGKDVKNGVK